LTLTVRRVAAGQGLAPSGMGVREKDQAKFPIASERFQPHLKHLVYSGLRVRLEKGLDSPTVAHTGAPYLSGSLQSFEVAGVAAQQHLARPATSFTCTTSTGSQHQPPAIGHFPGSLTNCFTPVIGLAHLSAITFYSITAIAISTMCCPASSNRLFFFFLLLLLSLIFA
jgi:hypothetical protein